MIKDKIKQDLKNREADIIVRKKNEIVVKQFECLDRYLLLLNYRGP